MSASEPGSSAADLATESGAERGATTDVLDGSPVGRSSVVVGRDALGNVFVTGDGNTVEIKLTVVVADTRLEAVDPSTRQNPYRGLDAFRETDSALFFGREDQITRLWTRFHSLQRGHSPRLLPILGPSGSGKSSLVRAGLLPELVRQPMPGMRSPTVLVLRPGANPLQRLNDVLARIEGAQGASACAAALPDAVDTVHRAAQGLGGVEPRVVVFLDQLEELFTECTSETARSTFLATLAHAATQPDGRVSVIFAMRNDFAGSLGKYDAFAFAVREQRFALPPMSHPQLVAAIEQPAKVLGHPWPTGLVENLVLQCQGRPGALPLLQFALKRLWSEHLAGRLADTRWPSRLIEDFVVQAADTLFEGCGTTAERQANQRIIQRAFVAMVQLGEGASDTRRVAQLSEIVTRRETREQVRDVLAPFVAPEARLITASELDGEPAYELTHEALIGSWSRLGAWLGHVEGGGDAEAIRSAIRLRRRLWHAACVWRTDGDVGMSPSDLELVRVLRDQDPDAFSDLEHEVVDASLAALESSARWRHRMLAKLGLAFAMVALIAGAVVWELYYRTHVDYYRNYDRRWGEPDGIAAVTDSETRARTSSFKFVRRGHLGHVVHVELVSHGQQRPASLPSGFGYTLELELRGRMKGQRFPYQWDFAYESDTETVSTETARDAAGSIVYRLQYRGGSRTRRIAEFLDERGYDAPIAGGNAERVEFVRSATGLDLEKHYLRRHGEPARNQNGISVERFDYDAQGNPVALRFFDEAGHAARDNNGVAISRSTFDDRGNRIELGLFDQAGRPTRHKLGYAGYRSTFDDRGNCVQVAYFDEAGHPATSKRGIAGYRATFDDRGYRIAVAYFDPAGAPTRNSDGIASFRMKFDEHGNATEVAYFDEAGTPVRDNDGIASIRSRFDGRNNETARAFFDAAGAPTRSKDGPAGSRSVFDDRGNEIEVAYFDEVGKPIRNDDGYAGYRSTFDDRGNETEVAYFDEVGKPIRSSDGYAVYRSTFDNRGNETKFAYFDEAGKPIRSSDGYAVYRSTFDDLGNEIQAAYFDEDGKPARHKDGYAGYRSTFDGRGNRTSRTYLDEANNPTRLNDGYAGYRSTFDDRGNQLSRTYVDEAGKPTRHKDGYAGYRSTFDSRDNELSRMYVDEAGTPTRHKDGYAGYRSTFDDRGHETHRTCLDEAGAPIELTCGGLPSSK